MLAILNQGVSLFTEHIVAGYSLREMSGPTHLTLQLRNTTP